MSDAQTDISRDFEREERIREFYHFLLDYLKKPTKQRYKAVRRVADQTDKIPQGYFGTSTRLAGGLDKYIELLKQNDKNQWVFLLQNARLDIDELEELKAISPFAGKILLSVDYRRDPALLELGLAYILFYKKASGALNKGKSKRVTFVIDESSLKDILDKVEVVSA